MMETNRKAACNVIDIIRGFSDKNSDSPKSQVTSNSIFRRLADHDGATFYLLKHYQALFDGFVARWIINPPGYVVKTYNQ